jgi:hypothetical protein
MSKKRTKEPEYGMSADEAAGLRICDMVLAKTCERYSVVVGPATLIPNEEGKAGRYSLTVRLGIAEHAFEEMQFQMWSSDTREMRESLIEGLVSAGYHLFEADDDKEIEFLTSNIWGSGGVEVVH